LVYGAYDFLEALAVRRAPVFGRLRGFVQEIGVDGVDHLQSEVALRGQRNGAGQMSLSRSRGGEGDQQQFTHCLAIIVNIIKTCQW
jgi:hypothetical protein